MVWCVSKLSVLVLLVVFLAYTEVSILFLLLFKAVDTEFDLP